MAQEEKEYNEFMADISNKAKEMYEKYNALSVSNKKKFMLYIEPLVRAYGTQGFINEMNVLFGIKV